MKLKQHFPLLVLITLSAALLVVLPLFRFFALQPQQDALQQLEPSFQFRVFFLGLTDGLWKAVLILLCFWSGVGINRLLLRIQDSAKRKLAMNGVIFGSLFLCVVLPILGLILTYTFFSPKESWVQLPDPPEAARTISGGIYNRIIIETEKGNYFSHTIPDDGLGWLADEKPDASLLPEMGESASPNIEAPGVSTNLIGVPAYPGSTQKIYYAILEDHTVWYLPQTGNTFFTTALLAAVSIPILIGGLLMLLGMGTISILDILAERI